MTNSLDVLPVLLELEAQVDQAGWDNGVGVWGLHADAEDWSDLAPIKIGGPDYEEAHPCEVAARLSPPPSCYRALVISYECWMSPSNHTPAIADPDRIDGRYLICALRTGVVWAVEHVRGRKPKAFVLDPLRAIALGGVADVSIILRRLVAQESPPSALRDLLEAIMGGDGPTEGFFIIGGGP